MRFLAIFFFLLIIALTVLPQASARKTTKRPKVDVTFEDGGDESEERKLLRKSCKYHHQCPRGQQCLSGFCTQRG